MTTLPDFTNFDPEDETLWTLDHTVDEAYPLDEVDPTMFEEDLMNGIWMGDEY
jgi:hypothetical protein